MKFTCSRNKLNIDHILIRKYSQVFCASKIHLVVYIADAVLMQQTEDELHISLHRFNHIYNQYDFRISNKKTAITSGRNCSWRKRLEIVLEQASDF